MPCPSACPCWVGGAAKKDIAWDINVVPRRVARLAECGNGPAWRMNRPRMNRQGQAAGAPKCAKSAVLCAHTDSNSVARNQYKWQI